MRFRNSRFVEPLLLTGMLSAVLTTLWSVNQDFGLPVLFWMLSAVWALPFFLAFGVRAKRKVPLKSRSFAVLMVLLYSPMAFGVAVAFTGNPQLSFSGLIGGGIGASLGMTYRWAKRLLSRGS